MKTVHSFDDVNVILKDIHDQLDALRTRDIDLKNRRVRNAAPSLEEHDYVIRKELVELYIKIDKLEKRIKELER